MFFKKASYNQLMGPSIEATDIRSYKSMVILKDGLGERTRIWAMAQVKAHKMLVSGHIH